MDLTAHYCSTRRSLEERSRILINLLSGVTSRLIGLVGIDHKKFNAIRDECSGIKAEIAATRRRLNKHREEHGC